LVAAGAMLFASKGLFAKELYARGVGSDALTAVRALIALPLFWGFAFAREGVATSLRASRRAIIAAAMAGFLCYYLGALVNFHALTLIDASVERVLLFGYPAIVVVVTALMARRWPARSTVLAVMLTWIGIFCVAGGFDLATLRANATGAFWVILSGLSYGIYFLIAERYTREIGSTRFTLYAMSTAALTLAIHLTIGGAYRDFPSYPLGAWLLLCVLAVLCMFLPALLQAEGVRRVGAVRGAIVSTVGPPTTILLAWLLLGERLTGWQWLGVALILSGVLSIDLARLRGTNDAAE
jgi:drug/metabolite transporter (DMT)-like permease